MNSPLQTVYDALPPVLRSAAASIHGYRLRWRRYGKETDRLVNEAIEREKWSTDQWDRWQQERLARLLHHAATEVPFYQEHWTERRRRGDRSSMEELRNWPVVYKQQLRENAYAFLARGSKPSKLYEIRSSGSTGTPVRFWSSRTTIQEWYALMEARLRRWNGVTRHDRWAMLGGKRVVPVARKSPPFWVWNAGMNQLYCSSLHIAPWSASAYMEALEHYRIKFLWGYSSSLYLLALEAKLLGLAKQMQVVITNAEPLFDYQRRVIGEVFCCPVRENYGLVESVCMASECAHGRLHSWPEAGVPEIIDDDGNAVGLGQAGRLIATGLNNPDMPLIRYDTRDRVQLSTAAMPCACGRSLPILDKIWGRCDDALVTPDGRKIGLLDVIFDEIPHMKEAQIVQEKLDEFRIRIVTTPEWSEADERELMAAFKSRVSGVRVTIEKTDLIERTWAGKFRVLVSKLPKPE
jgi:phenylacetate-coenzyme A ligase PaaK-like adenylate-forming protein